MISDVHLIDRSVDPAQDHVLGPAEAPITLIEYGSYDCPYCRSANEEVGKLRSQFGGRLRYVFRQRPVTGNALAARAAELAESADGESRFWEVHETLMKRSAALSEEDLVAASAIIGAYEDPDQVSARDLAQARARQRVALDRQSADASGVSMTPTFFINGRRYDGPWDAYTLGEAMVGSLGHRVQTAVVDFAHWAPSTGVLLLVATVLAVALTNSPLGPSFQAFWDMSGAIELGSGRFGLSVRHWINDALLSIFFLVVGLEIKREFTVGHLATLRLAALPISAAVGGMIVPAVLYAVVARGSPWDHGWGIPMATDTAFAVALIVMLGRRVPVELRIFLTAVAIVDDIGGIIVIALFYSDEVNGIPLLAAAGILLALTWINRSGVYRPLPYAVMGIALWLCVHAAGLHATLAAVLLAWFIPTRPPPNLRALTAQAQTVIEAEANRADGVPHHGLSETTLRTLESIVDRLESPAARLLRAIEPWSSYTVLPLFAFANAGVIFSVDAITGHASLQWAIGAGLVVGKPLGILVGSALVVLVGVAEKPATYSWLQLGGAAALGGVGFTMSLFIAGQALPDASAFDAAKLAVFGASVVSALVGTIVLACSRSPHGGSSGQSPAAGSPV